MTTPTTSKPFAVRNKLNRHFVHTPGCFCHADLKRALRFATLEEALVEKNASSGVFSDREVVQITYGLRWYSDGEGTKYCTSSDGRRLGDEQKDAFRFATAEAARKFLAAHPAWKEGHFGPHDKGGYRVVRFLKVVA